ncbi:cobalt/nickel transport system permease protein [Clostridium sp. DSM 8431]|uniref:energy-coupling factor transporter transmembrane component T family protein n=1 Tax=Clostridium sp. DSM 8431 TaxID=1761781 RepID=UPI0008EC056F|nr:energy-coupling factor transporter transmembrane component T [Clostridium sp. DSM 8431]SFU81765.1 cobalt/nickel transport system permease protein [Clostridium sp. DSM 8431]
MRDINKVLFDIRQIEELGDSNTFIHSINATVKILVTFIYVIKVLFIKDFRMLNVGVILAYPILIFLIGRIQVRNILKKVLFILPVVIGISIINLIIDFSYNQIYFAFILLFRCIMCLVGVSLLLATTGMDKVALGLTRLKIPKILVNQILLLYRYIVVLIEECYRIKASYELRTLGEKSMSLKDFGGIMGRLLLKSIDKSENIYLAMSLRGFTGDLYFDSAEEFKAIDFIYLVGWTAIFIFI